MKSIFICCLLILASTQLRAQNLRSVSYHDGDQKLHGLLTSNAGNNLPGVLILPAWKGIDNEAKNAALALEKEGYIVLIADIYGEGQVPHDNAAAAKIAGKYKNDYKAYMRRIELAFNELKKQGADADRTAALGYCFGGTGVLEIARAQYPVAGVICIHGGLAKDSSRPNVPIRTKVLIEHPAEDKSVSKEDLDSMVAELNAGNTDWQIITYANSGHTFTNPESPDYHKVMADRAWNHTLLFLKEILK